MAIIGIKWPFFEITYFFSKEVINHNIAQKKHNCQVSGARTHNEVYMTFPSPYIGHFSLAIIGQFLRVVIFRARRSIYSS